MAMSEEQIQKALASVTNEAPARVPMGWRKFARAIEAEVRKQDEALIRQMLDALETCDSADGYNGPYQFHDDKAVESAITAARARLGEGNGL